MADTWLILSGVTALLVVVAMAVFALRAKRSPATAADGLLAIGPSLIALGIIFGADRLVGFGLIGVGVVVAIWVAYLRRRQASR